jgi:hypothetical protein
MGYHKLTRTLGRHRLPALVIVLVAVLTGLGAGLLLGDRTPTALAPSDEPTPSGPATADPSETAIPASEPGSPSPTAEASSQAPVEVTPTAVPAPTLALDTIAVTLVDDLTVRQEPSASATALGTLGPAGEAVFVVAGPVEANGHQWYQLASMREPDDSCVEAPGLLEPPLRCYGWFGWMAGTGSEGDAWLGPRPDRCPAAPVDAGDFARLNELERLACFGNAELTLRAFNPPPLPTGCGVIPWHTQPRWLWPCVASSWLLLAEWQSIEEDGHWGAGFDAYLHPALGTCGLDLDRSECPWTGLDGQWIEVRGHLDDPAANTCVIQVAEGFSPDPAHLPAPDQVILGCRASFVVTSITPVGSP